MSGQVKTRQKFRRSCTNCATVKVKCSTTRPECARCVERGLECLYAPSNRYGRPPASGSCAKASTLQSPPQDTCDVTLDECTSSDGAAWDFNSWMTPSDWTESVRNIACDIAAFSTYHEEWNLGDVPHLNSNQGSINSSSSSSRSSSSANNSPGRAHSCLSHAASILLDVRNDSSSSDLAWATTNGDAKTIVGDVIFANRRATDQVSTILNCACLASDYQISVIVSLICFHMVDRYAKAVAAAKASLRSRQGSNHIIGSIQVLLDELRRITPLIGKSSMYAREASEGPGSTPASGFHQLQSDLERHLYSVLEEAEGCLHPESRNDLASEGRWC